MVVVTAVGPVGRGAPGPPAGAWPWPGLAEQREGVWLRPDNIDLRPRPGGDPTWPCSPPTPDGDPAALAAGLWDLGGGPGPGDLARRLDAGRHHRARTIWPPGSSCRPPCSATSRPIRCCPPSCCRPTGPGPRCAGPTTGGTAGTGRCCATWGRVGLSRRPRLRPPVTWSGLMIGRPGPTVPSGPAPETSEVAGTTSGPSRAAVRRPGGGDHRRGPGQGRSHAVELARLGADVALCRPGPRPRRRWATRWRTPDDLAETVRLVEEQGRRCVVAGGRRARPRRP